METIISLDIVQVVLPGWHFYLSHLPWGHCTVCRATLHQYFIPEHHVVEEPQDVSPLPPTYSLTPCPSFGVRAKSYAAQPSRQSHGEIATVTLRIFKSSQPPQWSPYTLLPLGWRMVSAQLLSVLLPGPDTCPSSTCMSPPSDLPVRWSVLPNDYSGRCWSEHNVTQSCHVISAGYFTPRSRWDANCHSPPSDKSDRSVLVQYCVLVPGLVNWIHFVGCVWVVPVNYLLIGSWPPGSLLACTGTYHAPPELAVSQRCPAARKHVLQIWVTQMAVFFSAIPCVYVPGARECVIGSPDLEVQSLRGCSLHGGPSHGPCWLCWCLTNLPLVTFLLATSETTRSSFFYFRFRPSLQCGSPSLTSSAWLLETNNLLVLLS